MARRDKRITGIVKIGMHSEVWRTPSADLENERNRR
jgi:hypothetical protein